MKISDFLSVLNLTPPDDWVEAHADVLNMELQVAHPDAAGRYFPVSQEHLCTVTGWELHTLPIPGQADECTVLALRAHPCKP
jgi:hypothetical protein